MDDLTYQSNIERLKKIEAKARTAARAEVWDVAAQHYGELLQFARSWLARNDFNVLWAQVLLTEAWVGLNKLDEANAAHQELFGLIGRPHGTAVEEREILKYIMQLQGSVANKLIQYKRVKDAMRLLMDALVVCADAFGSADPITCRIRENYTQLLSYKDGRSKKKLERSRAMLQDQIRVHSINGSPMIQPVLSLPLSPPTESTKNSGCSTTGSFPSPEPRAGTPVADHSSTYTTGLGIELNESWNKAADLSPSNLEHQRVTKVTDFTGWPLPPTERISCEVNRPSDKKTPPLVPKNPFARQHSKSPSSTAQLGGTEPLQAHSFRGPSSSPLLSPPALNQEMQRSKSEDLTSQNTSSQAIFGNYKETGERHSDAKLLSDPDEGKSIE